MNFTNNWNPINQVAPVDPRDSLTNDEVLANWQAAKEALEKAKTDEMEWRKYAVKREFPNPNEGMNTKELGGGFNLKAGIKYNYKLRDNDVVEQGLDELAKTGNDGSFIAERLVGWTPNFLLTEYRAIEEDAAKGSELAKQRLVIIAKFMERTEAAPTLEIKEDKRKKNNA